MPLSVSTFAPAKHDSYRNNRPVATTFSAVKHVKGDVDYFRNNRNNGIIVVGASNQGMTKTERRLSKDLLTKLQKQSNGKVTFVTGGSTGVMELAATVGRAIGVAYRPLDKILTTDEHDAYVSVDGLGERMDTFNEFGAKMLALPGGFGTIKEIFFQLHQLFAFDPENSKQRGGSIVVFDPSHAYGRVLMPFIKNWMTLRQYPHAAQQHVLSKFKIAYTADEAVKLLLEPSKNSGRRAKHHA